MKKSKALHRAFRKTNRIVEGTIIRILYPKLILGLRIDWKLFSTGKLVIGPAGIITGDIQCKMQISKVNLKELLELLKYLT
jgi:hypothetical protein